MKNFIYIIGISILFLAGCSTIQNVEDSSTTFIPVNNVTYDDFYSGLSPYGKWVNYPGYGNVWIPMEQGFTPYSTNGHWQYSNLGWSWQSGYQWGWAPFHYGRWFKDDNYGWVWTPGYEWAPAWVDWRSNDEYYGWSPMSPNGVIQNNYYDNWTFIPRRFITEQNIDRYYLRQEQKVQIMNNTTITKSNVGIRSFNPGPSAREVEGEINAKLRPAPVNESLPKLEHKGLPIHHYDQDGQSTIKTIVPKDNPTFKNNPGLEERKVFHVSPQIKPKDVSTSPSQEVKRQIRNFDK